MPEERQTYEKTHRTAFNRLKNRGTYDQDTVHSIINEAPVLHVSFSPCELEEDPFPAVLPMLGCMGSYPRRSQNQHHHQGASDGENGSTQTASSDVNATGEEQQQEDLDAPSLYLHGHIHARLIKSPGSATVEDHAGSWPPDSHPVTVAATLFDGVVLAYTPFNHSVNYRSAIVHGWASLVTDPDEKSWALALMTDNIVPNRWDNSRVPPTQTEMTMTGVLKVQIISGSAKVRAAGVGNSTNDMVDEEMRNRVWTGVVPAWTQYGTPIPAKENRVEETPSYLQGWIDTSNEQSERYALKAASTLKVGK